MEASWPPGSDVAYHTLTFGWILGELVRRVDGRMPRQFVAEEIVAPLDIAAELSIGLEPAEAASRVRACAMSERTRHDPGGHEQATSRIVEAFNSEIVARAQIPAANAFGTARALAAFYAALLEDRMSSRPRLLAGEAALAATSRQVETPRDRSQDVPKRYGLGFYVSGYEGDPFDYHEGPSAFGHSGQQSSVAYGDPALGVAVAYVTNGLHEPDIVHRRTTEMARAIRAACG